MQAPASGTYGIGELADLSGLPVKTIRFYSDSGVLPPSTRTAAGHRRYTEADLVRLQLVRTLRDLGLDLPTIRRVVEGRRDLAAVLAVHVAALETRVRGLRRQLAVARAAAAGANSEITLRRVHALARLDIAERAHLLDRFWDRVLTGAPADDATARRFRTVGSPTLPDEPTPEQIDAWIELTQLVADEDFLHTTQANADWAPQLAAEPVDPTRLSAALAHALDRAEGALAQRLAPNDKQAESIVAEAARGLATALGQQDSPAFRTQLLDQIQRRSDPRAARYWHLVSVLRGSPASAAPDDTGFARRAAAFEWLVRALGGPGAGA